MSKSRYNVVNPDDVIELYGADAMRLYELFMGPLEQVKMLQMAGVEGVSRFLNRVWRLKDMLGPESEAVTRSLHKAIRKVGEDTLELRFNTAVSQMMIFVNDATAAGSISKESFAKFLQILAPYAPHIAEELWASIGNETLIAKAEWPSYDAALCVEDLITVVVQINGKRRDELKVKAGMSKEELEAKAMQSDSLNRALVGLTVKKIIVVPDRIVNVVAA
jgi:leucyl-tRNA synthetase